ncbi:hypothetical protein SEPCBS57363_003912 [Sporothrix epigloea]|uniref:BZIP domain-containing protein n=1 Tax=Sporothrix epigloea TaxID=1892477 RepID=A0ABP0DP62_9PEZI
MNGASLGQDMGMDMCEDINMPLDPDLNINFENGLGQDHIEPMQNSSSLDSGYQNAFSTTIAPLSLSMNAMAMSTVTASAFDNIGQVQPTHYESASPTIFPFEEPSGLQEETFAYGNPRDAHVFDTYMDPPATSTASSYKGQYSLPPPMSREPEPTADFARKNSVSLVCSRTHQSQNHHNVGMSAVDFVLPSIENHDPFGYNLSRGNSPSLSASQDRRCSDSSGNSLESLMENIESSRSNPNQHNPPVAQSSNINGAPPADPTDWRARLYYCEKAVHKASLDASLVRLLEFPEGLDGHELAARRAANLRFDRIREQRLKDRNNEAAKRSRQRKVRRIEDAEQQIENLKLDRTYLLERVAILEKQLAAAVKTGVAAAGTASSEISEAKPVQIPQGVHKPYKLRGGRPDRVSRSGQSSKSQPRRSTALERGLDRGGHVGRATRSRASHYTELRVDEDDESDEEKIASDDDSNGSGKLGHLINVDTTA